MKNSVISRHAVLYHRKIIKEVFINTTSEKCVCCVLYLFLRCYEISYLRLVYDCTTIGAIFTTHLETVQAYAEFQMAAQSVNDPQHGFFFIHFINNSISNS